MSAICRVRAGIAGNKARSGSRLLAIVCVLLAASGCKNTNFLSTKDEIRLGQNASKQIEREYRVDKTSPDAQRVRRIGERLLLHADRREGVPYSFQVLDMKDVNAVSLPGGPIYVYRGLLDLVGDDDDALATIIGHEMGHVNARHAAKLISQQMAANYGISIFAIILKSGPTAQNIAAMAEDLLSLHYSRDDEYEADRRGLSYAYKAGFDPRGMIRFFKKLQTMEKSGGTPEILRTHPVTTARIDRAQKIIETQSYPYGQ
jgi:predicted Zn-dependent protease